MSRPGAAARRDDPAAGDGRPRGAPAAPAAAWSQRAAPPPPAAETVEAAALDALDRGDREAALGLLMDAYGSVLFRYCLHMLTDRQLAEDVHQTTFVQAFEGLARFGRGSTLRTWLFGIARHRCLDALKISRRRRARFHAVETLPEVPAGETGAERRLLAREAARALERCLLRLAASTRAAVLLRYQAGLSYPEMALAGGERATTLQARVVRALPVLRRCLEARELAR